MTRKKVKLSFISNDSSRKATFKKRKKGLIKKVNELSTLCGINACAIIYSPYDSNPEVWPSPSGVQRVVSEFRVLPEMDQQKKMVNQESFLRQRIAKASEHLKRQMKDNRELEMTEVMFRCLVGNMEMSRMNIMDLNDLGYLIDQYLKDANRRIEILGNSGMEIGESSNTVAVFPGGIASMAARVATTIPATNIIEVGSSSSHVAAATLFNPMQQHQYQYQSQQFRHPIAPYAGLYEQSENQNQNNHNHNQHQWFMEMTNRPENIDHAAQIGTSFMDDNHHHNNHHYQQQQQIPGESSTAPTTINTSAIIPVTSPNPTNNLWFH